MKVTKKRSYLWHNFKLHSISYKKKILISENYPDYPPFENRPNLAWDTYIDLINYDTNQYSTTFSYVLKHQKLNEEMQYDTYQLLTP